MKRKTIAVIGTGYVGLVVGSCLAKVGHHVTCIDTDKEKISKLKSGITPIYEPHLEELIKAGLSHGNLDFKGELSELDKVPEMFFIAVGTPSLPEGNSDIRYVLKAAVDIGKVLQIENSVVINKSTIPVGTSCQIKQVIEKEIVNRSANINFSIVSNPEFLREGSAIEDFFHPDRVIIGSESLEAKEKVKELYLSFIEDSSKIMLVGEKEAELTKYVSNTFLATKISFMNEVAQLCESLGVDINQVREGVGADQRIGKSFIYPGCGYGGSCFPKDVKELIHLAYRSEIHPYLFEATDKRNLLQKHLLADKVQVLFDNDLKGIKIALWGLSFKPETDDMREAPSISFINECCKKGASITAYDPVADTKELFNSLNVEFAKDPYTPLKDADALVLATEWSCFSNPDWSKVIPQLKRKIIIDGRNQYSPKLMEELGIVYWGVGCKNSLLDHYLQSKESISHAKQLTRV